jgi:hypothetical protein
MHRQFDPVCGNLIAAGRLMISAWHVILPRSILVLGQQNLWVSGGSGNLPRL